MYSLVFSKVQQIFLSNIQSPQKWMAVEIQSNQNYLFSKENQSISREREREIERERERERERWVIRERWGISYRHRHTLYLSLSLSLLLSLSHALSYFCNNIMLCSLSCIYNTVIHRRTLQSSQKLSQPLPLAGCCMITYLPTLLR